MVSSFSQIYGIPEDINAAQSSNSFLQDVKELGIGFGTATIDAGKSLLDALTPGIALFPHASKTENLALSQELQKDFTPLSAAAFLVFVLLYIPCVASIGAQKAEFGVKWAALSVAITMVVPWILAVFVYQGGTLLGLGA